MFTKEVLTERFNNFLFSDSAVGVLNAAADEARRFKHNYIGTEHMLLGLVKEEVPALGALGVDLAQVRSSVEFIIGRGDRIVEGPVLLTPRANKVIELSINEAKRGMHSSLSRNHILLGLVREGEGIAAGILESMGVSLEKVRQQVIIGPLGKSTIQTLNELEDLRGFLLDPEHDRVRKKQLGMIIRGAHGLISPQEPTS